MNVCADIYSIVETAKANELDVFRYFELLLNVLPSMEFLTNPDILEELPPWNESVHVYAAAPEPPARIFRATLPLLKSYSAGG